MIVLTDLPGVSIIEQTQPLSALI